MCHFRFCYLIYYCGHLSDDNLSLAIGVGIALIMLVVNLLAMRKTKQPMWEGMVVNKYSQEKYKHRDRLETYSEYTTVINTFYCSNKKVLILLEAAKDELFYQRDVLDLQSL
jgi:hypothetical protein